jgi:hypothetical protein
VSLSAISHGPWQSAVRTRMGFAPALRVGCKGDIEPTRQGPVGNGKKKLKELNNRRERSGQEEILCYDCLTLYPNWTISLG